MTERGQLWSWGRNEDGQLGTHVGGGSMATEPTAARTTGGRGRPPPPQQRHTRDPQARPSGSQGHPPHEHPAGLLTQSSVPERVAALMGVTVTHVACGRCHSIAVDSSGRLHSWGGNDDGALGHGDTVSRAVPTVVRAFDEGSGKRVVSVACGSRHTLALDERGTLYSWGGACMASWATAASQAASNPP